MHAHHFHGVAVGQAGGRQFASAGFGGLQIHRPVAGGVRRGGVGDVGALVAVGVDAQLHFRARLCRAGNGGEARVEVGTTLERQRDVALRWQATVTAAATTTAQGQTQHGRATQAIQQGFGRAIAQHGQDGGLEAGVVQHEVAVRQGAQRLGAYVGQHLAGAAQFAAGHGFGAGRTVVHAHGAAVGGAADAVVAFQDEAAGFGGCALTNPFGRSGSRARRRRRNALDHQVTVDLQHAQLFGVHVGPVQAELLSGSHQHTVLAGPELQMFDTAVVCSLNVKSCHGAFPAAKSAWIKGWGMGSGKSGGRCGVVRRDGNVNVWWFTPWPKRCCPGTCKTGCPRHWEWRREPRGDPTAAPLGQPDGMCLRVASVAKQFTRACISDTATGEAYALTCQLVRHSLFYGDVARAWWTVCFLS